MKNISWFYDLFIPGLIGCAITGVFVWAFQTFKPFNEFITFIFS